MARILIVAHKPPPFHGQSLIVQQILEHLPKHNAGGGGVEPVKLIHLNVRFSSDIEDIGRGGIRKFALLVLYMAQLILLVLRHRPHAVYYVPSPGKLISVYRDFALLGLIRILRLPRIFHWLAGGLSEWVQTTASPAEKFFCHIAYDFAALSIIPVESERDNAGFFHPGRIVKISNGISDPCPGFDTDLLAQRLERVERRKSLMPSQGENSRCGENGEVDIFQVLFMGHCTEDKGLFDTMEAVLLANRKMASAGQRLRFSLRVFGRFMNRVEESRFLELAKTGEWKLPREHGPEISLLFSSQRFIQGDEKSAVFAQSDVLCFPSYYSAEATPTVILDALAHGLPVISTNWRGIPEMLPPDGLPLCQIRRPDEIAERLLSSTLAENFSSYRNYYLTNYSLPVFCNRLREEFLAPHALHDCPPFPQPPIARPVDARPDCGTFHCCTLFNKGFLTRGLSLYRSLERTCDSFCLYVVAFDDFTANYLLELALPNMRVISLKEFEDMELLRIKHTRSLAEYYWTCASSVILYVLQKYQVNECTYLDADVCFYSDPNLIRNTMEGFSIGITPHRYVSRSRRASPELHGIYCVQYVTIRNDENGLEALCWWRERCLEWCYNRLENGKFGDQKYLDDWPERFKGVKVIEDPGAGLAPWNAARYEVFEDPSGAIQVRDKSTSEVTKLIFYHFHALRFYYGDMLNLVGGGYYLSPFIIQNLYRPYIHDQMAIANEIHSAHPTVDPLGLSHPVWWKHYGTVLYSKLTTSYSNHYMKVEKLFRTNGSIY